MSSRDVRSDLQALSRRDFEEVWGEQELDVIDEIYREDYRGHGFPLVGQISRQGYRSLVAAFFYVFSDIEFTIHRMDTVHQFVYTTWSITATRSNSAPDVKVTVDGTGLHRYEGRKVAETWLDFDWWDFFAQLAGKSVYDLFGSAAAGV